MANLVWLDSSKYFTQVLKILAPQVKDRSKNRAKIRNLLY